MQNGIQQASLRGSEGGRSSHRQRLFTDVNDNNPEVSRAATASQGQEFLAGPPYSNIALEDVSGDKDNNINRGPGYSTTSAAAESTATTPTAVEEGRRTTYEQQHITASLAEDPQIVADKMPQVGALGPGVANAVAAIDSGTHNITTDGYNNGGPNQDLEAHHSNQNKQQQLPRVFREPPARLPLHPHTLYCERCQSIKLPRAHHCRHCGTCILGMDHHCPWIGQCCGARNHHLFVSFCFWSCVSHIPWYGKWQMLTCNDSPFMTT